MSHGKQDLTCMKTLDKDKNDKINKYAIKRIFPTINASFIFVEMLILRYLGGENGVTKLIQGYRSEGQVSLVFNYQKSQPFQTLLNDMNPVEVKHYMWCMMRAVEHLSKKGVMHRDIKPANFLYNRVAKSGLLIDFGLSELMVDRDYRPHQFAGNQLVERIATLQK